METNPHSCACLGWRRRTIGPPRRAGTRPGSCGLDAAASDAVSCSASRSDLGEVRPNTVSHAGQDVAHIAAGSYVHGCAMGGIARHFFPGNRAQGEDVNSPQSRSRRQSGTMQVASRERCRWQEVPSGFSHRPHASAWSMQVRSSSSASIKSVTSRAMLLKELLAGNRVGFWTDSLSQDLGAVPEGCSRAEQDRTKS